jgi:hypothetical protein
VALIEYLVLDNDSVADDVDGRGIWGLGPSGCPPAAPDGLRSDRAENLLSSAPARPGAASTFNPKHSGTGKVEQSP